MNRDLIEAARNMASARSADRAQRKERATVPMNDKLHEALQDAKSGALTPFVIEWAGRPVKSIKRHPPAHAPSFGCGLARRGRTRHA